MQLVSTATGGNDDSETRAARIRTLINRKRAEKKRLQRDMEAAQLAIHELRATRRLRWDPLDDEIHGHFEYVLKPRRFAKDVRRELEAFYQSLMLSFTISPRGALADGPPWGSAGSDVNESDTAEADPAGAGSGTQAGPWDEDDRPRPKGADAGPDADAERIPTSTKAAHRATSLRALYHRLATQCHPDKATDEATRRANEELMREINGAYHNGDADALAALSAELGFAIEGDDLLETLAMQYERIKAEVRALRREPLGELVVEARRCKRYGEPSPMDEMAEDLDDHCAHLEFLASLFRALRAGAIGKDEFIEEILGSEDPGEDEILDMLLDALAGLGR